MTIPPEHAGDGGAAPASPVHLRPLGLGDILDGTFSIYQSDFLRLFLLGLVANVPAIAGGLLTAGLAPVTPSILTLLQDPAALEHFAAQMESEPTLAQLALLGVGGLLALLAGLIVTPWFYGSTIHLASDRVLGRRTGWREAARAGLRTLLGLLVTFIAIGIGLFLWWAVAAGVTAGGIALMLSLMWDRGPAWSALAVLLVAVLAAAGVAALLAGLGFLAVAPQAAALERCFFLKAVGRSVRLVRGRLWRTVGVALVLYLVWGILSAILSSPNLVLNLVVGGRAAAILGVVVGALAQAVLMPFLPVAFTLLYYDLRVRKEGLDLEIMAGPFHAAGGPAAAAPAPDDASS